MVEQLLPCPFCGGDRVKVESDWAHVTFYEVRCWSCRANSGHYFSEAEVIPAWNRRTPAWVSVENRLPDRDGEYLVHSAGCSPDTIRLATFGQSERIWLSCPENYTRTCLDPTHWMELPPAPTEGD